MQMKKTLAAILSTSMTLSMLSVSAFAAEDKPLMEDAANSWAASSIDRWVQQGIVQGDADGSFKPYRSLTRGELATVFVRMFGLTKKAENRYDDLDGSEWYADAVLRCTAAGILEGDGRNVNATAPVTRQEAMTMFARAMGMTPDASPDLSQFTDGSETAGWAAGYMAPLAKMGILQGVGADRIAPHDNIDRASTMALLDKAIEEYITAPGDVVLENGNGFTVINIAASAARANDAVGLSGTTAGVVISAGTQTDVAAADLTADTIRVDGSAAVSLHGNTTAEHVTVHSAASVAIGADAQADTVTLSGPQAELSVAGTVGTVTIASDRNMLAVTGTVSAVEVTRDASGTTVSAEAGGQIDAVSAAGAGMTVQGDGIVAKLAVSEGASDITVNTTGTKIDNNSSEAVTAGIGSVEPGKAGTSQGAEQAPTQDGPSSGSDSDDSAGGGSNNSGGSGGSGSGDSDAEEEQQADIVKAPLFDQSGTIEAEKLVQDYRISSTVKADVTEVTIHGTRLMKHENAQHSYNYWIGFGIPAAEGNTYYAGYGEVPEALGEPVASIADRTYEENGKAYNTVYFGLKDRDLEEGAYVVVKNGEEAVTYKVSFDVTLAPVAENLQLWIVNDEESYKRIPSDYTASYPWDESYLEPDNAAALPWLALSYDSNVTGTVDIQVTKDGEPVGIIHHESSTVNPGRYQLWHLTKPAESEGKDYFDQVDPAGTYVVTITKDSQTVTTEELVYAPKSR